MSNTDNNKMMRAMMVHTDGREQPAELTSINKPEPKKDEVRIRVMKSAIDNGGLAVIGNAMVALFIHAKTKPLVIGWHYSGTIDAVGSEVANFKVGDNVFGFLDYEPWQQQGAFCEFITVQATKTCLKPDSIGFDIAAASTTESITALQAMRDCGGLSPGAGQKVLVIGGGGVIGSAAIQIAKTFGAHVTAVCSTNDVERVKATGANVVIDRKKTPDYLKMEEYADSFHLIFDTPASSSWFECQHALVKGGRYVVTQPSLGFVRDIVMSLFTSTGVRFVSVTPKESDLKDLHGWLLDGKMKVTIGSNYKVRDLNDAIAHQKKMGKVGRIVIDVDGGW